MSLLKALPFLFIISCSSVRFTSNGSLPVYISPHDEHTIPFQLTGKKPFYFFGLIPPEFDVTLDDEIRKAGYYSAANIKIYQERNSHDWLMAFLSFGLYAPISYEVTGFGLKDSEMQL